ncbi:YueI family protein [Bacillus andreraoultii]|uniref:YueI family protein n=1 Tax=Bacillus andreraoultii TaxID=1499685 RepID=UPI00053A6BCA|nr:YueI family protein [Bacillus andreraoultii]
MANGPNLEDYLNQGVYGKKEINPEEKRKFLGTFRERIVVALTVSQLYKPTVYDEVEQAMKSNRGAKLLLNGSVDYQFLSKYVKIANDYQISFTIVENKEHDTEIGLVLAYDYAVDKENIFVADEQEPDPKEEGDSKEESSGVKGFFKSLFS